MNAQRNSAPLPVEAFADESIGSLRRRRVCDSEMDITPMIDITFLLLIFFLVASRLETEGRVELPEARHGTAVTSKNAVVITIARGPEDRARIYKGDTTDTRALIESADLSQQQRDIATYIDTELRGSAPKQHVLIKAERAVKHRDVARVAQAVGQATDVQMYVAVLEVP